MNDLRPVALTSVLMKSCERIVLRHIKPLVDDYLDPQQYAYRAHRNTEDAVLNCLEKLYSHLEHSKSGHSARIMFFDFSSAFNTIQPHVLADKMLNMNISHDLIFWILNYLTNRSQYVHISSSNCMSDVQYSNTGAPQGTVLAPFLFTLYTSDVRSSSDSCHLIKFADDTALVGLIKKDDDREYLEEINHFVGYCDKNFLELNVKKTKEMNIDFRRVKGQPREVVIKENPVEQVSSYKYLGVVIDDQLAWHEHIDYLVKRVNPRLYCLRRMSKFDIDSRILTIFYNSVICSVFKYCMTCWGGNVTAYDKSRIDSVIRQANRILGGDQLTMECMYHNVIESKLDAILADENHPLFLNLSSAIISRSGRMRLPSAITNRHKSSFIPQCIKLFNFRFNR